MDFFISCRNTPACAGKTNRAAKECIMSKKHPRVCGENIRSCGIYSPFIETPPRVRGKPFSCQMELAEKRNTPACAGKTPAVLSAMISGGKHPRVCGENLCLGLALLPHQETPPRVRGKPEPGRHDRMRPRNTPACAGKTSSASTAELLFQKHPRVCGENRHIRVLRLSLPETPPRVRGKLYHIIQSTFAGRNTPACAGKTHPCSEVLVYFQKHPRVCGENRHIRVLRLSLPETPPRVRGKLYHIIQSTFAGRNTPACAGKTT